MNKHGLKYFRLYDAEIKLNHRKKTRERERERYTKSERECLYVCVRVCMREKEKERKKRARKRIKKDWIGRIKMLREKTRKEKEVSSFLFVTHRRYFDTSRFAQIKCHVLPLE